MILKTCNCSNMKLLFEREILIHIFKKEIISVLFLPFINFTLLFEFNLNFKNKKLNKTFHSHHAIHINGSLDFFLKQCGQVIQCFNFKHF